MNTAEVVVEQISSEVSGRNEETSDSTEKVKAAWTKIMNANTYDRVLSKMEIISAKDGKMEAEMLIEKEHLNIYGTLHGGLTSTIVDVCTSIAMATNSKPGNGVTVDLNISYLSTGKLNDTIVIEASTMKIGRKLGFADCIIKSKTNGQVIAKGSQTKYVELSEKFDLFS